MVVEIGLNVRPNQFNEDLTIGLSLNQSRTAKVEVYGFKYSLVSKLHEGVLQIGSHRFTLNGSNLLSGEYIVILTIFNERYIRKVVRVG